MINIISSQIFFESVILFIFIILIVWFLIFIRPKPKKCKICNQPTEDTFVDQNDKREPMCRNHLVDKFKENFLASNFNIIVIEPDFKKYPMAYLYATPSKLGEWVYPEEAQNKISDLLSSIPGKKCEECQGIALIGYLNKEDYEFPFMENIKATPKYLCKKCALRKIEPLIQRSEKSFYEGVYAPTDGEGVYHVQEY